ncbi:hypothetical protein EWM64_g2378 [Hericium alpestre]|uniref:Uncharacterized protein n=1 Tax=Hericium alpestre TaxID=135208 RepID=A0A4Z0A5M0_9AGAM|nr:hypothetical protein EWM64_g2378 [Hericium alpestre]
MPSPTVDELFPAETLGLHNSDKEAEAQCDGDEDMSKEDEEADEDEDEDDEDYDEEMDCEYEEDEDEDAEGDDDDEYEELPPTNTNPYPNAPSYGHPSDQNVPIPRGTLSSFALLCQPVSDAVRSQFKAPPHAAAPELSLPPTGPPDALAFCNWESNLQAFDPWVR